MKELALKQVAITQGFWAEYQELIRDTVIPYQYDVLHDSLPGVEPSGAIANFRIAAGLETGDFYGKVFQDSDLAKWLEAVGYSLSSHPDAALETRADALIDLIEQAQQPDGYFNTFYIINGLENRFTNMVDCHELYTLGHFIEAAVAYYEGTKKDKLLRIVRKMADLVGTVFGRAEGQIMGYPGHQEIELALLRLYEVTSEERYCALATYFLEERGQAPSYLVKENEDRGGVGHWNPHNNEVNLAYHQAHLPVREQTEAVGHAVRAVYMYTAMAHLAKINNDSSLREACNTLWGNIVNTQLYLTGGIGQTSLGEAFTFSYDLPNDTIYSETCAAIGLVFFAHRMLELAPDREYADVIERSLYNTVLAGMGADGRHFFYVNPLEVWPEASEKAPVRRHVLAKRPGWYPCACCPPNVSRLLSSLGKYIYGVSDDTLYIHQYMANETTLELAGTTVALRQATNYPWDGNVVLTLTPQAPVTATIALRLPGWCEHPTITLNGEELAISSAKKGYLYITRQWAEPTTLTLDFPMKAKIVRSHPKVRANRGLVAVTRGPLVYCLEQIDNGENLSALLLNTNTTFAEQWDETLVHGAVKLVVQGARETQEGDALYSTLATEDTTEDTALTFVPHYLWGNRGTEQGAGEMLVWVRARRNDH